VKLTTSRYFTPSGDSIHEIGVSPDIVVEGTRQFPNQNLQTGVDRETDVQLMEALQQLKHQRVMHSRAPD